MVINLINKIVFPDEKMRDLLEFDGLKKEILGDVNFSRDNSDIDSIISEVDDEKDIVILFSGEDADRVVVFDRENLIGLTEKTVEQVMISLNVLKDMYDEFGVITVSDMYEEIHVLRNDLRGGTVY